MKNGWAVRQLTDICQLRPPKIEVRERLAKTDTVSFLPMEDLGIDEKFVVPKQTRTVSAVEGSYTYFADGDVLLAKITPCFENGKLGVVQRSTNGVGFGSSEYFVFRPNGEVSGEWLYYYFSRQSFRDEGAARMSGAVGHKRVSKEFIESYPVPVPPPTEQRRIVGILDETFAAIGIAKANAEKNLHNARQLFERQLQTVFRKQGDGWHMQRLSNVCSLINGRAYKQKEMLNHGKYPLLRVGNFFTNKDWFYSDLELEPEKYCDHGDLLYCWSASFGPRIWEGGKVIYHYHIWKVIPRVEMVEKRFLLHLLAWDVEQIKQAHGTGTTMMHVGKASMEARVLPIAPLSEQNRIVAILDELRKEANRLQSIYKRKLVALERLRKSVLHQAFTGNL
jgi:type I restriction enzyme, S subunit